MVGVWKFADDAAVVVADRETKVVGDYSKKIEIDVSYK